MGWKELQSDKVNVSMAEAESNRFGFSVLNIQCGLNSNPQKDALEKVLTATDCEITVFRYPTVLEDVGSKLSELNFRQTYADPTVYWSAENMTKIQGSKSSLIQIVEISHQQLSDVISVVNSSFENYRSHWHYNPRTKHLQMATAYAEWVTNSIQFPDTTCYLMTHSDVPAGMAMTHMGDGFVEILLAGVAKCYQGQGLYQHLL